MLEKFRAILTGSRVGKDGYVDSERESLITLLVLIMFSDHELLLCERETIDKTIQLLDWPETIDPDGIYLAAVTRVRIALGSDEKMEKLLEEMRGAFVSDESFARALSTVTELAKMDGQFSIEEASFIQYLARLENKKTPPDGDGV